MASNDQWPPVALASAGKGSTKINGNKRNIKESQQETLKKLNEMFGSTLEPAVILSVVQNCHWELQPSIEGLITLSETVENPLIWNDARASMENIGFAASDDIAKTRKISPARVAKNVCVALPIKNLPNPRIIRDPVLPQKSDKPKRGGTKNRMGSFCGNIAKLKSTGDNALVRENIVKSCKIPEKHETSMSLEIDPFFHDSPLLGATGSSTMPNVPGHDNFRSAPCPMRTKPENSPISEKRSKNLPKMRGEKSRSEKADNLVESQISAANEKDCPNKNQNVAIFDSKTNIRKNESESLCGLKVQYRLSGMESSSDDDADVVIEDESSDYAINLTSAISTSVSEFLSSSMTQTPPKHAKPEVQMISTPSPPTTPRRRSIHDATLDRIVTAVKRNEKILILLRGLPGSGKTTLAKNIIDRTIGENSFMHIFSTDDFFLINGVYKFDPAKISEAHATNHRAVSAAMSEGRSPIIVDNTNIQIWELRPYASMAVKNGYAIEILEPDTPWSRNPKELAEKNIHNLTKTKIRERASRYEILTSGKKLLDIYGLRYAPGNEPPQLRPRTARFSPIETKPAKIDPRIAVMKSNWDNHQKNNYVLTNRDIEIMRNIDETHNPQNAIDELPIVNDDSANSNAMTALNENSMTYADRIFNDYLQELQDSNDESFEMLDDASSSEKLSDIVKSHDTEGSSASQRSLEITNNTCDSGKEDSGNNDSSSNGSQQMLGAIGSERKGSLATITNNHDSMTKEPAKNGNVLSQCWDFTLILGRHKLHSQHGHYVSSFEVSANDIAKNDEIDENIAEKDGNFESPEENPNFQEEIIANSKLDTATTDRVVGNDDELEISRNLIDPSLDDDTELKIDETPALMENNIGELGKYNSTYFPANFTIPRAKYHPQARTDVNDSVSLEEASKADIKIAGEEKNNASDVNSTMTFGSLLNLLKTSIIGSIDESSTTIYEDAENIEDSDKFLSFENDESRDCSDELSISEREDFLNKNEAILINLDFVDSRKNDKLPRENEKIVVSDSDEKICNENASLLENISTNPFREEIMRSRNDEKSANLMIDNMNSISWKESPFPIDDTKISIPPSVLDADKTTIATNDASTMTTLYDFNVAYVGGTSEPQYRELTGVSRSINAGTKCHENIESRTTRITFDKSSMTGDIDLLADAEMNSCTEKEKDSTNRLDDLIEMFPHYPSEYLKTLYEQQCNCNFDWVVDVLILADVPNLTIENYEKKRRVNPLLDNNEASGVVVDAVKLWKIENEELKKRSHSSSPKNRRGGAKNFRTFSLEFSDDRGSVNHENSFGIYDDNNTTKKTDDEEKIIDLFYANAVSETNLPVVKNDSIDAALSTGASGLIDNDNIDDDTDETLELNFGREFINQLENTCGNADFPLPDEFRPVIRIKKSMIEQLYGLWIESMDNQMKALHAQLDERMARDEAMARAVDREETSMTREPVVPNLEEIMNMEMALARYQNELKEKIARETPNDMASRLTRQMLYELVPDIDQQTLSDILKAHDGNFKETCEIIEVNIGRKISKIDTLRKQQSLLDRVNEERKNRDIQQKLKNTKIPVIVVNPDIRGNEKSERLRFEDAIERGQNARMEAQKQFSLRIENYNKAAEAYRKGNPEVAAYYSQMVKLHTENIKAAHADAADEFLSAQMYTRESEETLDLHNLFVREALQALDLFLEYQLKKLSKSNKRSAILFIITGHGARSNNGLGKIKPAVSKKLISRNIRFTEANPGCLRVTLSRKNGTLD